MTLRDLGIGESGRIVKVGGEKMLRRRLLDMGITPGTTVTVKKAAPLGDPIELLLRGYVLSLRLEEAENILIEDDGFEHAHHPGKHPHGHNHHRHGRRH